MRFSNRRHWGQLLPRPHDFRVSKAHLAETPEPSYSGGAGERPCKCLQQDFAFFPLACGQQRTLLTWHSGWGFTPAPRSHLEALCLQAGVSLAAGLSGRGVVCAGTELALSSCVYPDSAPNPRLLGVSPVPGSPGGGMPRKLGVLINQAFWFRMST